MECEHREEFLDERSANEAGHNLCRACREEAIKSIGTAELLRLIKPLKTIRLKAIGHFREILPRLIHATEILEKRQKDESLDAKEKEAAETTFRVFLFTVSYIDEFEINEVLKERAGRG